MDRRVHPSSAFEVDGVAVIGRTFEEYLALFDLEPDDLEGETILDCPSGAGSFVATARDRGVPVVGADVVYRTPPAELAERCRRDTDEIYAELAKRPELFVWDHYGTLEERARLLREACETFLADYPEGRASGRYVPAALPDLPFATDAFSLVLSAHLLFLYGDRLDYGFHLESCRELVRVASEQVRIYPVVGLDGEPYPHLEELLDDLASGSAVESDDGSGAASSTEGGCTPRLVETPFEFLEGADRMLVIDA